MSRENVEIAKRALHAWRERDQEAMDTLFHPDFEYHGLAEWPGLARGYRGRAEALRRQSRVDAELDEFWAELLEVIDAGERVVFVMEDDRHREAKPRSGPLRRPP